MPGLEPAAGAVSIPKPSAPRGGETLPSPLPVNLDAAMRWLERMDGQRATQGIQRVPDRLRPSAEALLNDLTLGVRKASPEGYAVAMDRLMEFAAAFGIKTPDRKTILNVYRETLGDLPQDLLEAAISRTMADYKYQNMPKPADIRQHVRADLAQRKIHLMTLRMALSKA